METNKGLNKHASSKDYFSCVYMWKDSDFGWWACSLPTNHMLQVEDMDLYTGITLVQSASECIGQLHNETELRALLDHVPATNNEGKTSAGLSKRPRLINQNLQDYVAEKSVGQNTTNEKSELELSFYSVVDAVHGELCMRFGARNSQLIAALAALDPEANRGNFMDIVKVKPLLELTVAG